MAEDDLDSFFYERGILFFLRRLVPEHKIHPVIRCAFPVKNRLIGPGLSFPYSAGKDGPGVTDRSGSGIHQIEIQLYRFFRAVPCVVDIPVHPFIATLTDRPSFSVPIMGMQISLCAVIYC